MFAYHDAFNPDTAEVEDLKARYRAGKVGDVEVKTKLAKAVNAVLEPLRERRTNPARTLDDDAPAFEIIRAVGVREAVAELAVLPLQGSG